MEQFSQTWVYDCVSWLSDSIHRSFVFLRIIYIVRQVPEPSLCQHARRMPCGPIATYRSISLYSGRLGDDASIVYLLIYSFLILPPTLCMNISIYICIGFSCFLLRSASLFVCDFCRNRFTCVYAWSYNTPHGMPTIHIHAYINKYICIYIYIYKCIRSHFGSSHKRKHICPFSEYQLQKWAHSGWENCRGCLVKIGLKMLLMELL